MRIAVDGGFASRGAASDPISIDVEVEGNASEAELQALIDEVDAVAEIPRSIREGTRVTLRSRRSTGISLRVGLADGR